jgi:hypothetical protein
MAPGRVLGSVVRSMEQAPIDSAARIAAEVAMKRGFNRIE